MPDALKSNVMHTAKFLKKQSAMIIVMIDKDVKEVHFGLRLLDRSADHTYCHNYPGVNLAQALRC